MYKSWYKNQIFILRAIQYLYLRNLGEETFDLDPTYGNGCFYKKFPEPKERSDINPKKKDIKKIDCRKLLVYYEENSKKSIIFDPPFVVGCGKKGIIESMYGDFRTMEELRRFYKESLSVFYKILNEGGILVVKCMDTVSGGKNYFNHIYILNTAEEIGFIAEDLMILLTDVRIPQWNIKNQEHVRKYHSYFWIFRKSKEKGE